MNLPESAGRDLVAEAAGAEGHLFGHRTQAGTEQAVAFLHAAVGCVGGAGAATLGLAVRGRLRREVEGHLTLGEQSPGLGGLLLHRARNLVNREARVHDELQ